MSGSTAPSFSELSWSKSLSSCLRCLSVCLSVCQSVSVDQSVFNYDNLSIDSMHACVCVCMYVSTQALLRVCVCVYVCVCLDCDGTSLVLSAAPSLPSPPQVMSTDGIEDSWKQLSLEMLVTVAENGQSVSGSCTLCNCTCIL